MMFLYKDKKPEKICIYKGVFPSGEIKNFMQMVPGVFTTLQLEYNAEGYLSLVLIPLVEPLAWYWLSEKEFYNQCLHWNKKVDEFEEDFSSLEFTTLPKFIKGYYQVKKEYDDNFIEKLNNHSD